MKLYHIHVSIFVSIEFIAPYYVYVLINDFSLSIPG